MWVMEVVLDNISAAVDNALGHCAYLKNLLEFSDPKKYLMLSRCTAVSICQGSVSVPEPPAKYSLS